MPRPPHPTPDAALLVSGAPSTTASSIRYPGTREVGTWTSAGDAAGGGGA
ncbi:hypothetical protein ACFSM7_04180 [Clavibacter michiganensis subsp. tessellarius]